MFYYVPLCPPTRKWSLPARTGTKGGEKIFVDNKFRRAQISRRKNLVGFFFQVARKNLVGFFFFKVARKNLVGFLKVARKNLVGFFRGP